MSVLKKITKQSKKYQTYKQYVDELKTKSLSNTNQQLVPFDSFDLVSEAEKELLDKKDLVRKARNKRKANKQ